MDGMGIGEGKRGRNDILYTVGKIEVAFIFHIVFRLSIGRIVFHVTRRIGGGQAVQKASIRKV